MRDGRRSQPCVTTRPACRASHDRRWRSRVRAADPYGLRTTLIRFRVACMQLRAADAAADIDCAMCSGHRIIDRHICVRCTLASQRAAQLIGSRPRGPRRQPFHLVEPGQRLHAHETSVLILAQVALALASVCIGKDLHAHVRGCVCARARGGASLRTSCFRRHREWKKGCVHV